HPRPGVAVGPTRRRGGALVGRTPRDRAGGAATATAGRLPGALLPAVVPRPLPLGRAPRPRHPPPGAAPGVAGGGRARGARLGTSVQEPHARRPQNACQALPDPAEALGRLPFPEAALNAAWVAERAHFELLPERLVPPKARIPPERTPERHLEERCYTELL